MNSTGERGGVSPLMARVTMRILRFHYYWYLTSLVLCVVAIGCQFASQKLAAEANRNMAKGIATNEVPIKETAGAQARRADGYGSASVGLGIVALACWGVSLWYGEPGRQSIIFLLLAAWLLMFFVLV